MIRTVVVRRPPAITGPAASGPAPACVPAGQDHPVLAAAGPGRSRRRPKCGPAGSASRRRQGSAWSPRCRASGPPCTWTPPSPCRSASRHTRPTRLRAWLATGHAISGRTRRFAKWSAICSFALGMAGQVAYHLLAQAGVTRAPWAITTLVSCLPVLVLAMGTALAHMLRADAATADHPDHRTGGPASVRSAGWSPRDQSGPDQDHAARGGQQPGPVLHGTGMSHQRDHRAVSNTTRRAPRTAPPELGQARLIASRLAASGKPVSRRALRNGGVKGSNEALNLLARTLNAERAASSATAGTRGP